MEVAMKQSGTYDTVLQMFREQPREADLSRLHFLRWLGERGLLEHPVAGAPVGDLAAALEPLDPSSLA
jgi:hypothetical protein